VSVVLGISVDCGNAMLVARFWARALRTEICHGASRELVVLRADALCLAFRKAAEGKFVRNRVRLDLVTHDFEFETARLLSLGAVRLADVADGWTTFADVEGNEFDLIDGADPKETRWPART
jgi:hypothetical protein